MTTLAYAGLAVTGDYEIISIETLIHKDCQPELTVSLIKNILSDLGIHLIERTRCFSTNCHSANVYSKEFPRFRANGKGPSKAYALASAYAEFMERLQGRVLLKNDFGLMAKESDLYPDIKYLNIDRILFPFDECIPLKNIQSDLRVSAFPFFNTANNTVENLPWDLLAVACGSTGLCAGNSPEEAIVQGICEVMERYVVRHYFTTNTAMPRIPEEKIHNPQIRNIIVNFKKQGYCLIAKDATLGGKVPVLAVIVFDKNGTLCKMNFASDPVFEVALFRCLSEICQGFDSSTLEAGMFPVPWMNNKGLPANEYISDRPLPMLQFMTNGHTQLPYSMFMHSGECSSNPASMECFTSATVNNRALLKHLQQIINSMGRILYIRDLSFLGFPSYRIYIPGMSPMRVLDQDEVTNALNQDPYLKRTFLRIKDVSANDCLNLARYLEKRLLLPSTEEAHFYYNVGNIWLQPESDLYALTPYTFIGLLYLQAEEYRSAWRFLSANTNEGCSPYKSCILGHIRGRAEGLKASATSNMLSDIYDHSLTKETLSYLEDQKNPFSPFALPHCGDCQNCPVQQNCYYDLVSDLNKKMWSKMTKINIDQSALAELFV
jgi:ribosomal protein S12 methylthiotransferase accessory factor